MPSISPIQHHLNPNNAPSDDDGDFSTTIAKITAMIALFACSLIVGGLPIALRRHLAADAETAGARARPLLALGGGVLLCTTFLHLLPEVEEAIERLHWEMELPFAQLLMCIGFFLMYFVEEGLHTYLHKKEKLAAMNSTTTISTDDTSIPKENKLNVDHHQHSHPHHNHQHKHNGHSHLPPPSADSATRAVRGLLVVLALSVHELFEGLSVGLEHSANTVWYMFGAVAAHKFVIAFCVGVELAATRVGARLALAYVFVFAAVSPLGIGAGIAVSSTDATATDLLGVVLQGLASGTLLYVVFFEILQGDRKSGLKQCLAVLVGFVIMLGITMIGE